MCIQSKVKIIKISYLLFFLLGAVFQAMAQPGGKVIWQIGKQDRSPAGMALAPEGYKHFIENDFGFEDRSFMIGHSDSQTEWPYVLPGPVNSWGGTGPTAGIRSHFLNIDFGLGHLSAQDKFGFEVNILQTDPKEAPSFKISVNGKPYYFLLKKGNGHENPVGPFDRAENQNIRIEIPEGLLKDGSNHITLTTLQGGWLIFDNLALYGPAHVNLLKPGTAWLKTVSAADYETEKGNKKFQALLVDVSSLKEHAQLEVMLDGSSILKQHLDTGRYVLEALMPAVKNSKTSRYEIRADGLKIGAGTVKRSAQKLVSPADYVNTMMGVAHSRWMIAPGPWMPFGMVKLSPDNQRSGWQAGYDPTIESIGTFSHIHEWTMTGLGTFPVSGKLNIHMGDQDNPDSGYRSRIDKTTEKAPLGYYRVDLTDYDITAELTAGTRTSFQKYTYHRADTGRIMIDLQLPTEYDYKIKAVKLTKISDYRIEGVSRQLSQHVWSGGIDQEYNVHFVMEFDRPIRNFGYWKNGEVLMQQTLDESEVTDAGMYVEFDTKTNKTIQLRTGISYVSIANADLNLQQEISKPFGWSFDKVYTHHRKIWNEQLGRISINSNDHLQKERFYTNMYRSLASRNTFSDVDGSWVSADEKIRKLPGSTDVALGCDAFWNTFWNLNQFWNLVTPEWSSKWVRSQLAMYDANGWLAKGPAGMEYIPVMVAEHEIPLMVSAYQMGIRDYDVQKSFEAMVKMQTTASAPVEGGYAGNRDLMTYLQHQYVPYDQGRFSNSLEYSFDDWTVSQMAKALDKEKEFHQFRARGSWWKNAIDTVTGYARMRDAKGDWYKDFDPFKSGANEHYVEGNAWQLTFFVPQDIPGLARRIGKDTFLKRLEWGFEESYKWRFNGPNDQYWDYPVVQGNQQSMHFAFLFNWVGRPWLTQKWSRAIMDRYYGHGLSNAYLGDEDQGQMSAWFVMNALGLFQMDGGSRVDPIYEIGSPLYEKVTVDLGNRYGRGKEFVIEARNTSKKNKYIQKATLNGVKLDNCWFPASQVLKGGSLILEMGPIPNENWGTGGIPVAQ
ncbi:GH92 family glycosyl hydrolase [Sphingobacterium spiritivorum]|nr:GH92 family glycosyl hydrolase [Sphingobacterium spiritivorum]